MDREDRLGDYYGVEGGWGKRGGKVEWGEGRVGEKEGGREKRGGGDNDEEEERGLYVKVSYINQN